MRLRVINIAGVGSTVGIALAFIAAMMLIPLVISLLYQDGDAGAMALSAALVGAVGTALILLGRGHPEVKPRDGFAAVTLGWIAICLAGAVPFYITGAIPSLTDCIFESVSGFTTTGASILGTAISIESLPHGILFWRSLTHWIGGMGIILLALAILPLLEPAAAQLYAAEVTGPVKDKLTPRVADTAKIMWVVYVIITAFGVILLCLGGMSLFDAACQTFGALATGGFSTKDASIAAFNSSYIEYVIILIMFLGGTNFALHYGLFRGRARQYWQSGEFRLFVTILLSVSVFFTIYNSLHFGTDNLEKTFRDSLFSVTSVATTTCFTTVDWEKWGYHAWLIMLLLELMGAMACSTGGAIKLVRIRVLVKQIKAELQLLVHRSSVTTISLDHKVIPPETVRRVLLFILIYLVTLACSTLALSLMGIDLLTGFSASVACMGCNGPGVAEVGPMDNYGWMPSAAKWILCLMMLLGRLELWTIMVLFTRQFWRL